MTVVCLQITAYLAHSSSLKDKRSAVKRLCAQLRREYGASVCEDGLEMHLYEEPVLSRQEIKSEIY